MTGTTPADPAGQPGRDDLTPRIFRALYQDFDLLTIGVVHVVTPKGTQVFVGDSLGQIARQISDHEHGVPTGPSSGALSPDQLPARMLPRA
jgi:hypothetical protein